ncbi:MAG: hypothetical protein CVV41_22595 [Candidatus Riflebacteria bacterium HGW-Riflebacteria-1]|jgi:hypothetical protein|nr:MAG: hypothetical protein CVV41_22595 [Candidatus Riflebacteria bacterium HGW-Riflebacteria-1]
MKKLLISLVFALLTFSAAMAQPLAMPDSREYKVLLNADNFASVKKGCELFWDLVEKVANDHGFQAKKTVKSSPNREICFIDTPRFDLNKSGFVLRIRAETVRYPARAASLLADGNAELTLKFRASDLESVLIAPVEPAKAYGDDVSSEVDVVVKAATPVSVFSRSGKIASFGPVPQDIKELLQYYPRLSIVGLNNSHGLKVVNDLVIVEQRILHGSIDFGRDKVKTLFSIWYKKGESKPMVAEFSFKIKTDSYMVRGAQRSQNLIDKFFVDLVRRGKLFISPHQTKTGLIYQYQTED